MYLPKIHLSCREKVQRYVGMEQFSSEGQALINEACHELHHRLVHGLPRLDPLILAMVQEIQLRRGGGVGSQSSQSSSSIPFGGSSRKTMKIGDVKKFGVSGSSSSSSSIRFKFYLAKHLRGLKPPSARYCIECIRVALASKEMANVSVMPPDHCWFQNDEAVKTHIATSHPYKRE